MRPGALFIVAALLAQPAAPPDVTVAAAANLSEVFQTVGARFQESTGIHPVFSFGSTAQLTQQIENGAPFDVFAAADSTHVDQLEREGKLMPGTKAVYATGVLALWVPPTSHSQIRTIFSSRRPCGLPVAEASQISACEARTNPTIPQAISTFWRSPTTVPSGIEFTSCLTIGSPAGPSLNAQPLDRRPSSIPT